MHTTRDVITTLLSNIGSRKEVEQYLDRYASAGDASQFAVIKIGGGVLRDQLDAVASSLTFLHQVGLTPIVVHGAGPQLDAALGAAGIQRNSVDGLRVTTPEVLEIARPVMHAVNLELVEALEALGTRARPITAGVFSARPVDPKRLGLVGEVTEVALDPLRSCVRSGALPILSCLGETPGGQILNVNADVAARELAARIRPFKVIFLTPTGGLLDGDGRVIPAVNLAEEYEGLIAKPWVSGGMRLKLTEIGLLLNALPHTSSVSITRPDELARELFTHRGSGTLLRRGERIRSLTRLTRGDMRTVKALIEQCFERPLIPDYFTSRELLRVYLSDPARVAAILTHGHARVPYLDKFAVSPEARGAGLGASLWHRMIADTPRLYWRSRIGNPINSWYFHKATGSHRSGPWIVFWHGLHDFETIGACVEQALALPPSLIESAEGQA